MFERTGVSVRKHVIMGLLFVSGSRVGRNLRWIDRYERAGVDDIRQWTDQRLERLLLHAAQNVPYYRDVLRDCGVVADGRVRLEHFEQIPLLTKEIIRREGERLYSKDHASRRSYANTSGGSTGEPVRFLQDKVYDDWNVATKIYFNRVLGKDLGDREIKFWGSDRDILKGMLTLKDRLINRLYNRRFFNSYQLDETHLKELIELNNTFRPKAYWSYMESALELARYLLESGAEFHGPDIVISTIGPLTDEVRQTIEAGMKTKVYNQYGSREAGVIACQCREQKGLHTFPWRQVVEVTDAAGRPLPVGEQGNVTVTTLDNYSMPLIRYDIGDAAILGGCDCPCGRKTQVLETVLGRTLGYFKKADGSLAHSHFLVQALFYCDWIQRFQIVQEAPDRIVIRVELKPQAQADAADLDDIRRKTQVIMGEGCRVEFEFIDRLERSASGKYVYTICNVK